MRPGVRDGSRAPIALTAMALAAVGCGDAAAPPTAGIEVRDSSGVAIVEFDPSTVPVRTLASAPTWSFESLSTADGEHVLSGVIPMPLADGRLVIGERSTDRVWFGSPEGGDWTWAGGSGDGPSELRGLADVALDPDDDVWVFDESRRRLVRYSSDGEWTDALPIPDVFWGGGGWSPRSGAHYFLGASRASTADRVGVSRPDIVIVRWDPQIDADTLASVPGSEWYLFDGGAGGTRLGPFTYGAGAPEGHWVGDNADPEITLWTENGRPSAVVRWPRIAQDMQRVGDSLLDAFIESIPPAQRDPAVLDRIASFPLTASVPQFTGLVGGAGGSVAIGPWWPRFGPPSPRPAGRWIILGAEGLPTIRVDLPRGFEPTWFGEDHVLGVRSDDLGRERVERWEILPEG